MKHAFAMNEVASPHTLRGAPGTDFGSPRAHPIARRNHCRMLPPTRTGQSRTTQNVGDTASDDLIGSTLGKKFFVRSRIGSGGMGAVYEAEHMLTKRVGALKLLHRGAAASARIVERFVREASAAG